MNEEKKKKKIFYTILGIILFIFLTICISLIIFNISTKNSFKNSSNNNSIFDSESNNDKVPQNIQDKLESKTLTIVDTLNKSLSNANITTNVDFEFLSCDNEDDLYAVYYIIYENEEITGSYLKFYYSKEDYKLIKTSYIYTSLELSVGKVIDKMTHSCILGNLPFSIDPVAFYSNTNSDIISMYEKMYKNDYTFLSGYKISVNALSSTLYEYKFQKID